MRFVCARVNTVRSRLPTAAVGAAALPTWSALCVLCVLCVPSAPC